MRGGRSIAEVRTAPLRVQVVTRYRARTAVERWQLQDRLRVRLVRMGVRRGPRFGETPDGRLAFTLWTGLRWDPTMTERLATVDQDEATAGS